MPSAASEEIGRQVSTDRRSNSWERKSKAIVYDPASYELKTERCEDLDSEKLLDLVTSFANPLGKSDSFEVPLPRWRNQVDIYLDPKARSGFVATIKLDKLKWTKNWQRRLGHNYKVLHVRGTKPGTTSRTSSRSTASILSGK